MTMNANNEFTDASMLHAFLDGELDGAHEEVLFRKLSSSGELRAEMQDSLAIRSAIQHDTEAYTPPAVATSAVFGALGFSMPPAGSMSPVAGSGSILRRFWVSGGTAMMVVAAAVFLLMQFPQLLQNDLNERVVSAPASTLAIEETPALGDIPISVPVQYSRIATPLPAAVTVSQKAAPRMERELTLRPLVSLQSRSNELPDPDHVRADQVYFYDLLPSDNGLTLYARNVALRSDPAPEIVSQSEPWFRNVNIGLMYGLSEHHSIGIEGGQEAFSQRFDGIENGRSVGYGQNPMAYWLTAVYQFNGDALLPHVHPFAQVQLGGAFDLGGLARAAVGLKFKPFDRIAIVVGAEGSMLMYRFQNNWFQTDKIGMTYGVAYEF